MKPNNEKNLYKQAANKLLELHQKRKEHEKFAKAIKIMYREADCGIDSLPQTYSEFTEKVAKLMNEDLEVVEKAIERNVKHASIGELDKSDPTVSSDSVSIMMSFFES